MKKLNDKQGFTLIELLIVVVIIGILAAIAIPKFSAVREKGFRAAMMADLRNLASSQELYYNGNFEFSNDLTALDVTTSDGVTIDIVESSNGGWSATAEHVGIPTESCAVSYGSAAIVAPSTVEGVITCSF